MRVGYRYYDPSTGRFISRDLSQDGYNWYAYCENDPVNLVDADGLAPRHKARARAQAAALGTMLGISGLGFAGQLIPLTPPPITQSLTQTPPIPGIGAEDADDAGMKPQPFRLRNKKGKNKGGGEEEVGDDLNTPRISVPSLITPGLYEPIPGFVPSIKIELPVFAPIRMDFFMPKIDVQFEPI